MTEQNWNIVATSACTGQGSTPTQLFAGVATYSNQQIASELFSVEVDGLQTACLVCPAIAEQAQPLQVRVAQLAAQALSELFEATPSWPAPVDMPLALQLPVELNSQSFIAQLIAELATLGQLMLGDWLQQTTIFNITDMEGWLALKDPDQCLWLSADCLLNAEGIARTTTRVATEEDPEGIVLGEAAAVLWLSRKDAHKGKPGLLGKGSVDRFLVGGAEADERLADPLPFGLLLKGLVNLGLRDGAPLNQNFAKFHDYRAAKQRPAKELDTPPPLSSPFC